MRKRRAPHRAAQGRRAQGRDLVGHQTKQLHEFTGRLPLLDVLSGDAREAHAEAGLAA